MKAGAHIVGGVAAGSAAALAVQGGPLLLAVSCLAAAFGSLLPDVDHPGATISRRVRLLRWTYVVLLSNPVTWVWAGVLFGRRGPFRRFAEGRALMRRALSHRAMTHSLLGATCATAIFWCLLQVLGNALHTSSLGMEILSAASVTPIELASMALYGFVAGYLSHLILDMMTRSGVPLLLPASRRPFWILPQSLRYTSHK